MIELSTELNVRHAMLLDTLNSDPMTLRVVATIVPSKAERKVPYNQQDSNRSTFQRSLIEEKKKPYNPHASQDDEKIGS